VPPQDGDWNRHRPWLEEFVTLLEALGAVVGVSSSFSWVSAGR